MRLPFTAGQDDHDRRLESVVRKLLPHLSLSLVHKALRQGDIRLNGAKAPAEARVSAGDVLLVWDVLVKGGTANTQAGPSRGSTAPVPQGWILVETPDLLVINKPSGLVVHRGDGPVGAQAGEPLDERVRAYLATQEKGAPSSLSFRSGPLHRLDRETSGIVVFSKTLAGARTFSQALAGRQIGKTYLAVLTGSLEGPWEVRENLVRDDDARTTRVAADGAASMTHFRPLARAPGLTLAEVDLGTGRTHQIRVHAQSLGLPLAGDQKYGGGARGPGPAGGWILHAWKLESELLPAVAAPLEPGLGAWVEKTFKISL